MSIRTDMHQETWRHHLVPELLDGNEIDNKYAFPLPKIKWNKLILTLR
jgi:hypothetical protein